MFKRLKCLFKGHNYNSLSCTNDYTETSIKTYTLLVCEKCDKAKLEIQKISNVDAIYKRWTELAGVANGKKTPNDLYARTRDENKYRDKMKDLLKSSRKLKLKKMKVDVKSFVSADEALAVQNKEKSLAAVPMMDTYTYTNDKGKNNG